MRVKDVLFRWLIQRPVAVDLREDQELCTKYQADALVLCMWIDKDGYLQVSAVASITLGKEPEVKAWGYEEVPFQKIENCKVLPRVRPQEEAQKKIWNVRKKISAAHPAPKELIQVRKTSDLDSYRMKESPDIVICHAETEEGCHVLVHTDGFNGTQLLGTVVDDNGSGILHKGEQVMIYTMNSIRFLDPILIATRSRYE